jgi:pimeloyl-ACP methyl ester carboxylesterase
MLFENKILELYKSGFIKRYDNTGDIFYYSPDDFEGLVFEPFSFAGQEGQTLRGGFYYYGNKDNSRIIVFDHGMGNGRQAYHKEIERICREGYTVASYDHTGTSESDGDDIRGFVRSLSDLDHFMRYLESREELRDATFSVVGHSWGGFSTMNISALHDRITHVVAMAGFVDVKSIVGQFLPGPMKLYAKALIKNEEKSTPGYSTFSAKDSLMRSSAKAMIIHSTDDPVVSYKKHFLPLKKALEGRENTVFVTLEGKGHNPNYTESAVKLKDAFFAVHDEKIKSGELDSAEAKAEFVKGFDWDAMTEQDETVFSQIFEFLKS